MSKRLTCSMFILITQVAQFFIFFNQLYFMLFFIIIIIRRDIRHIDFNVKVTTYRLGDCRLLTTDW